MLEAAIKARDAVKTALRNHSLTPRISELGDQVATLKRKDKDASEVIAALDAAKAKRAEDVGLAAANAALAKARGAVREQLAAQLAAKYRKFSDEDLEKALHRLSAQRRDLLQEMRAVNIAMGERYSAVKVSKILGDLSPEDKRRLLEELSAEE